jgi:hypothetical protein
MSITVLLILLPVLLVIFGVIYFINAFFAGCSAANMTALVTLALSGLAVLGDIVFLLYYSIRYHGDITAGVAILTVLTGGWRGQLRPFKIRWLNGRRC